MLDTLAPEQRPIAEQVLRGGVPAVRQAVDKQNEGQRARGEAEIHGDELVVLAEKLLPALRSAEWRDRADAALAGVEDLDLRDLRSVVVASESGARDDESRAMAEQLREALTRRVDEEHTRWLDELTSAVRDGRTVRALRLSSRPPKAGAPLPPELTETLVAQASENLGAEASPDRWITVIDALSFSPVRAAVMPSSKPENVTDEMKAALAKVADRLPQIAAMLGVEAVPSTARRPRRGPGKGGSGSKRPRSDSGGKGSSGGKRSSGAKESSGGRGSSGGAGSSGVVESSGGKGSSGGPPVAPDSAASPDTASGVEPATEAPGSGSETAEPLSEPSHDVVEQPAENESEPTQTVSELSEPGKAAAEPEAPEAAEPEAPEAAEPEALEPAAPVAPEPAAPEAPEPAAPVAEVGSEEADGSPSDDPSGSASAQD